MDRRFSVFFAALALGLPLFVNLTASGQTQPPSIPAGIVTAQTVSLEQQGEIARVVTPLLQKLATASDEEVAKARLDILRLYNSAITLKGTPAFFAAISTVIADGLEPAAKSDRIICRINAMLVGSRALSPKTLAILSRGLEDPTPAVRYAAGRAMAMMLDPEITGQDPQNVLNTSEFKAMVEVLAKSMDGETNSTLLAQLTLAMSRIPIEEARENTLASLASTLKTLQANPTGSSLANELVALRSVYINDATNNDFSRAKLLAETGLGYAKLAASQLASSNLDLSNVLRQQREQLIDIGLATVQFASSANGGIESLQTPRAKQEISKLQNAISQRKWIETQLHAADLLAQL